MASLLAKCCSSFFATRAALFSVCFLSVYNSAKAFIVPTTLLVPTPKPSATSADLLVCQRSGDSLGLGALPDHIISSRSSAPYSNYHRAGNYDQCRYRRRVFMTSASVSGAGSQELSERINGASTDFAPSVFKSKGGFPPTLSLGAPRHRPDANDYTTKGNIDVSCKVIDVPNPDELVEGVVDALDSRRGVLLTSSYEFPGRYARWTLGFVDPPLEVAGKGREFKIRALNERGRVLLPAFWDRLSKEACPEVEGLEMLDGYIEGKVKQAEGYFKEEERSKQPSLFSVVRAIVELFHYDADPQLGLYGAFGYDLTFQFDSIPLRHPRETSQKDLILYIPDSILVVDQVKRDAWRIEYEFAYAGASTEGLAREGEVAPYVPSHAAGERDTTPGAFAQKVVKAKEEFKVGNLFEAVLSQTFKEPCKSSPGSVFRRLRSRNPSPYGFLINLGEQEYLVGASPEMFVRCERTRQGIRVETCPISGTIERGSNPLEDAQQVRALLTNKKEESELTMCTDVDRNDKSRICEPSSVRVLGRRQIEMYSRLIHTVDHVEGYLRESFDALDAFLCHTWAVTVTGAPKTWAIRFVEQNEESPRAWYGGAVGLVGFDGHLNTGLTLRTVRVKDGMGEVRAGATLLFDSDPHLEEAETELKASAMIDAIIRTDPDPNDTSSEDAFGLSISSGVGKSVLLIDHEDSFVHTLGNYLRQTGAQVNTIRSGEVLEAYLRGVRKGKQPYPDLAVMSPGPGNPSDFGLSQTIQEMIDLKVPVFGVCLGLQGMVEHFGGKLSVLSYPMHGKPSMITVIDRPSHSRGLFDSVPDAFEVARYHSLYGVRESFPEELRATAITADGVVMAIEHKDLPFAAVQFHPESILTNPRTGLTILANCLRNLKYQPQETLAA